MLIPVSALISFVYNGEINDSSGKLMLPAVLNMPHISIPNPTVSFELLENPNKDSQKFRSISDPNTTLTSMWCYLEEI